MFRRMDYLGWMGEHHQDVESDLGSSVLQGTEFEFDRPYPSALSGLDDPPEETALSDLVAAEYPGIGPENVLVTSGASHGNFLVAMAALSEARSRGIDDPEVLVENPGYEPLIASPEGLGATVTRLCRRRKDEYDIDLGALADAVTDQTALITITNRHNPSGRMLERDRLRAVAEVVDAAGALLLVDEVYAPVVSSEDVRNDGAFGGPTAAGLPNTIVTQSFTKFFGLGGIRVGWIVAPTDMLDWVRQMFAHLPVNGHPSTYLARRILHHSSRFERNSRELLARNHELLASFADRDDVVGFLSPGNSFAFLGHERADGDAIVSGALAEETLVVPGRFFDVDDRVRICVGTPTDEVRQGLNALRRVFDSL